MASPSEQPVSDYAQGARPLTTTPPAAKVQREIGHTVREVAMILAATTVLAMGKIDAMWWMILMLVLTTGHFARSKAEGAIGEQTLTTLIEQLVKGRGL